ncbi:MAG: hypothetical protein BGO14_03710 [Chlamydiales bacterium 38-26]|nr:F-box protein [Chlamydiales bacterium]OJV09440.1 MAG: hypothetical protein BGO14_03710 [Chlamydiales bacterium 38-26]
MTSNLQINDLPNEVLDLIFSFCGKNPKSRMTFCGIEEPHPKISKVCKRWEELNYRQYRNILTVCKGNKDTTNRFTYIPEILKSQMTSAVAKKIVERIFENTGGPKWWESISEGSKECTELLQKLEKDQDAKHTLKFHKEYKPDDRLTQGLALWQQTNTKEWATMKLKVREFALKLVAKIACDTPYSPVDCRLTVLTLPEVYNLKVFGLEVSSHSDSVVKISMYAPNLVFKN